MTSTNGNDSTQEASKDPEIQLLSWIKVTTVLVTLIASTCYFLILARSAFAQPGTEGFPGGAPPPPVDPGMAQQGFPPPPPPAPPSDFFDDEEDFFDEPTDSGFGAPPRNAGNDFTPAKPGNPNDTVPNPRRTRKGIEVGASDPNGVVNRNRSNALQVDTETGLGVGSNEMIVDFNYPDADILDIAKTLGKLTGKNFILDKDVKGRITIISNSPITVADAWKAFLTALDMNNYTIIPSGKYIRIARQRDARDKQIRTYTGRNSPDTDTLVTRVFALKYIGAEEIARVFRSFSPANARIIAHEQTNTVIVTDTGANIAKLSKMLSFLDVEGFDAGIEVVPVRFASAVELSKLIDTLIPGTGAAPGMSKAPGGGGFGGNRGQFQSRRTKEGGIINTIIADERTNSLIIHANQKGADQVRDLVARLDKRIPAPVGGGKIHVVYLQFADAEEISKTLNNFSQASSAPRINIPVPGGSGGGIGVNPQESALFEGQIKVSADKATNSLVITASPADFVTIQRVINRLDIPRDEVYAEVAIMEMSINKNFEYSANVFSPVNNGKGGVGFLPNADLAGFLQSPATQKGVILGFASGKDQTITVGNQQVTVKSVNGLIKALQTNAGANVIATPQIMTLDNVEATFESAENIPFATSTAVNGAVAAGVTKEKVALAITIKPQINKISNFVKMDITTKIGDVSPREPPAQVAQLAVATLERTVKTSVVVADSDTVVLGGLVRDKITETTSKVPVLGDIPLLGWLFKARSSSKDKINLVIFITPHIVRQYEKVRAILDRKLKERDDFIEKSSGGDDPHRSYRDDMIRRLPNIKEITSYKAKKNVSLTGNEDLDLEKASNLPDSSQTPQKVEDAPNP